jgi:4-amino-4-deoxy-L-arabinose transferase-like glycosyltransferase
MTDSKPTSRLHPLFLLILAGAALLLPFLGKPFHIDDPLFVWAGQHIRQDPSDPYGFPVTWGVTEIPMAQETENPPLACYYLAAAGTIAGWSEPALHLAFLVPALALLWGTYRLAEMLCSRPLLAGLLTLACPVVLVSATSVMCDTLMLSFWVWSVVFWLRGLRQVRPGLLLVAAALAALASLTKFYGVCLVPLLASYALVRRTPWRHWVPSLALVVLVLVGYELLTRRLYGQGHLAQALAFTSRRTRREGRGFTLSSVLTGLSFTGACVAPLVFAAPWLAGRRLLLLLAGLVLVLIPIYAVAWNFPASVEQRWLLAIQGAFWPVVGLGVLTLALAELRGRRDAESLLLVLWVLGTFVFAAFLNWTINGRSILPMAPAVAFLVARRLDTQFGPATGATLRPLTLALVPSFALAVLVAWADYRHAVSARQAAEHFANTERSPSSTLWFVGHWGFQFYMQQHGASPWDFERSQAERGDFLLVPSNNYPNLSEPPAASLRLVERYEVATPWLALQNPAALAGFFASTWGPLPFGFYPVPPEHYSLYEATESVRLPVPTAVPRKKPTPAAGR